MFKVRDLLIVAAMVLGGSAVYYRSEILKYFEPAIVPVEYYVDAPQREREMKAEIEALEGRVQDLVDEMAARLAKHATELSHQEQLMKAAGDVIQSQEAEITMLRAAGEATRLRYLNLCTRLRELGADEDVTIAAD